MTKVTKPYLLTIKKRKRKKKKTNPTWTPLGISHLLQKEKTPVSRVSLLSIRRGFIPRSPSRAASLKSLEVIKASLSDSLSLSAMFTYFVIS